VAFPELPARPSVPLIVDPDAWLRTIDGRGYARRVQDNGCVAVGDAFYYIGRDLSGREVTLVVDATAREFVVVQAGTSSSAYPSKG
jgi:hypothetical protein